MSRDIGLLIIGDEIMTGRRHDKHMTHAIQALAQWGVAVSWVRYVGDEPAQLVRQFEDVLSLRAICFSFGGIGATPDDCTRQAFASALNVPLERHPEAARLILDQFGDDAYPHRIRMADLPAGATLIPNQFNAIPAFSCADVHCLPGFPQLAWPMLQWVLNRHYGALRAPRRVHRGLILDGVRESELIDFINTLMVNYPDVKISSLPQFLSDGGSRVELGVSGEPQVVGDCYDALKRVLAAAGYQFTEQQGEVQ